MPTTYTYEVEDLGEFARAEFGATATFKVVYDDRGNDYAAVEHVELYELVSIPTRDRNGIIRGRTLRERRDCPAWFVALIERNYQSAMLHVYNAACDDARYADTAASRADDYRNELVSREMRGAM